MKTIIAIVLLLCTIGAAAGFYTYRKPTTTEVMLMRDITDRELAQPDAMQLLSLFSLSANKWNGALFTLTDINDVSYNKNRGVAIAANNKWLSNDLERDSEVREFNSFLSGIVADAANDSIGKSHSSIYLPLANRLTALSTSAAQKRILVLYSDLMENTPPISFYNKATFSLLQTKPETVVNQLEQEQLLPSLTGITIYLIYQPADAAGDSQYQVVSAFFKKLLESKGATVIIAGNLTT